MFNSVMILLNCTFHRPTKELVDKHVCIFICDSWVIITPVGLSGILPVPRGCALSSCQGDSPQCDDGRHRNDG